MAVVGAWLAQRTPADLDRMARQDTDMAQALRRELGWLGTLGPAAIRAMLGPGRVSELARYTDWDFEVLLDDLLVSHPNHGAILAVHEDWYLRQMRALRDIIVTG